MALLRGNSGARRVLTRVEDAAATTVVGERRFVRLVRRVPSEAGRGGVLGCPVAVGCWVGQAAVRDECPVAVS